jgi:hypothetical protein
LMTAYIGSSKGDALLQKGRYFKTLGHRCQSRRTLPDRLPASGTLPAGAGGLRGGSL